MMTTRHRQTLTQTFGGILQRRGERRCSSKLRLADTASGAMLRPRDWVASRLGPNHSGPALVQFAMDAYERMLSACGVSTGVDSGATLTEPLRGKRSVAGTNQPCCPLRKLLDA